MRVVLTFFFGSLNFLVYSQNLKHDDIEPDFSDFRLLNLKAQKTAPSEVTLPFSSIKIIDSRFDTSKIGFSLRGKMYKGRQRDFSKITFEGSVANAIETYYNSYYKNSFQQNGFQLLIVLKRFWLSGIDNSKNINIAITNVIKPKENMYCKWEYYLGKEGKYVPVKRVDTILYVNEELARYITEEFDEKKSAFIKFGLKVMIELYDFEKKLKNYEGQNKKTIEEIFAYNNKRNDMVVLKDSVLKKGVYLNFDEFKNNKPSLIEYKEEKVKYKVSKSQRYLTDMQGNLISEYWGYSDGAIFRYGKFGNYKIFRVGNTFEFCTEVNIVDADNSTPVSTKGNYKRWVPYQIDMETGLIY